MLYVDLLIQINGFFEINKIIGAVLLVALLVIGLGKSLIWSSRCSTSSESWI